jgi:parvulin-like peptidyl-prolyl isomerase
MLKLLPLLILFSLLPGCTSSCGKGGGGSVPADAAAVVNGKNINLAELETLHKRAIDKFSKTGRPVNEDLSRKMRGSILRKMIDDEIIKQKAEALGITIDRFERTAALEKYKARMGGPKGFEVFLQQQNLSEEQILETVSNELIREKIAEKSGKTEITEQEIKAHYEANAKLYMQPEMVHARHILIKFNPADPKEKNELVLKKAHSVLQEAQSGKVPFESLVQKYSEGPSVKQNGDLGFFPRGRMVKEFEDAAFNAPLKTAVGPIKTDYGYHIIYVEEKNPSQTAPLEEVRPRIVEFMTRNKQARKNEDLLASLRKEADIKISDASLTAAEFLNLSQAQPVAKKEVPKEAKEEPKN